jgi:hypothetical protein
MQVAKKTYSWKFNNGQTIWGKKGGALGNIFGNTLETFWELDGSTVGTHSEHTM